MPICPSALSPACGTLFGLQFTLSGGNAMAGRAAMKAREAVNIESRMAKGAAARVFAS